MSYCRSSSMNWMCDLYCYGDIEGRWVTHVGFQRKVREPKPSMTDAMMDGDAPAALEKHMADLASIPYEPIELPHAGTTIVDDTLEGFRDTLLMPRKTGYRFPDSVLERVYSEIKE